VIYITGDTHGNIDFEKLKVYFAERYSSKKDVLIILGDAGILWSKKENYVLEYSCLGPTVLFIDGNHENFDLLNKFPVVDIFGGKAHRIDENIYHLCRGEIFQINGLSFLAMGGATSIDRDYREAGVTWWKEENITAKDMKNAEKNLQRYAHSVDYVLTHCAPSKIVTHHLNCQRDHNSDLLQDLMAQVTYRHWYFGHYHCDVKIDSKFRCFYNGILEIPAFDLGSKKAKLPLYVCEDDDLFLSNWTTGRHVSITPNDLPEWYFEDHNYYYRFYRLKDVVDVAFRMSPFDNHISKDSRIYLSYQKKLGHQKDYSPVNEEEWDASTWRANIVSFTLGLEKYSPHLKLDRLKACVNRTYDQYNNNENNLFQQVYGRPFPLVKTPPFQNAQYVVSQGKGILGSFELLATAQKFISLFIKSHYPDLTVYGMSKGNESSGFIEAYDVSHNLEEWIYLRKLDSTRSEKASPMAKN
jgi:predicted phosphodiesterase